MIVFGKVLRHGSRIPAGGAAVNVWVNDPSRTKAAQAVSDQNGVWQVEIAHPGRYIFEFGGGEYAAVRMEADIPDGWERVAFDDQFVPLLPGTAGKPSDGQAVYEDVVTSDIGKPLWDVHVQAYVPGKDYPTAECWTGLDGRFRLNLKPGKWEILMYRFGYNNSKPIVGIVDVREDGSVERAA